MNKKLPLLITLMILCASLLGQNNDLSIDKDKIKKQERHAEIDAVIKKIMDTAFIDNEVPAKWRDENSVVLSRFEYFQVYKKGNKLNNLNILRQRIKIQSKSALNTYSEYSFQNDFDSKSIFYRVRANYYLDFKIIKPNGEIVKVDVDKAVEKSITRGKEKVGYKKIAIPNLEVGDILEYYIAVETLFPKGSFHDFDPEFYPIVKKYPIKKQILLFDLGKNVYLNAKSVNKAPQLKTIEMTENRGLFLLVDTMRNKLIDDVHINFAISLPHLKYQIYYSNSKSRPSPKINFNSYMVGERLKIKDSIDVNSLKKITSFITKNFGILSYSRERFIQYINLTSRHLSYNHKKKDANKIEVAKDAYYFLREYCFRNRLDKYLYEGKYRPYGYLGVLNNANAFHVLSVILQYWDIDFNIVYSISSQYSKMENWLFVLEATPIMEIVDNGDTIYISAFHNNSNPEYLSVNYAGNEAYRIPIKGYLFGNARYEDKIEKFRLPKQKLDDNTGSMNVTLSIENFKKDVNVDFEYKLKGNTQMGWDTALYNPITSYEQSKSIYTHSSHSPFGASSNTRILYNKNYEKLNKEVYTKNKNSTRNIFRNKTGIKDFEVDTLITKNVGRWLDNDTLNFNFTSTLPNLIDDVGDGYILDIGPLIAKSPSPTEIPDSVDYVFQISGPSRFTKFVDITLPDNYTIDEFSEIDTVLNNSIGSFHIETSTYNNKYRIEINEEQYTRFAEPNKWSDYKQIFTLGEDLINMQLFVRKKNK